MTSKRPLERRPRIPPSPKATQKAEDEIQTKRKRESLFDVLLGELVNIVDFAFDIYKTKKRSPRIAVNASSWWNINLPSAAVQAIRDKGSPNDNPIERNILFYTLQILEWGIQLHFVFDGPKWLKKGRGKQYPGHDPPSELLREAFTNIGVPWHDAPASAEAECAKMERRGIVDAVWSEDGDALAFGCRTLIKSFYKILSSTAAGEKKSKSPTQFRIYKLDELALEYPGMHKEGFILNSMFNRSSTEEESYLPPKDVLKAAERGFAKSLCAAKSPTELQQWARTELDHFLKEAGDYDIPPDFPKWEHMREFLVPAASSTDILSNLPTPPEPFADEDKLYTFLTDKVQFTLSQWVIYGLPYRIVRSLHATKEGEESQHDRLKITCEALKPKRNSLLPKRFPNSAVAEFLLSEATKINVSSLFMERAKFETMVWLIRKSNFNQQPSLVSLWSPNSGQKGKVVLSSTSKPRERLVPGGGTAPSSTQRNNGNGEGPSGTNTNTNINREQRQNTPPSPSAAPATRKRKRKPNSSSHDHDQVGRTFKVSKVTRPTAAKTSANGKEKELSAPSSSDQTIQNDTDAEERLRSRLPPSLTPDQTSTATEVGDEEGYIIIDSD